MILPVLLSLLLYLYRIRESAPCSSSSFLVPVLRAWHIDAETTWDRSLSTRPATWRNDANTCSGSLAPTSSATCSVKCRKACLPSTPCPKLAYDQE